MIRKFDILFKVYNTICDALYNGKDLEDITKSFLKYKVKANKIELEDIKTIVHRVYDFYLNNIDNYSLDLAFDMLYTLEEIGFNSEDNRIGDYMYNFSNLYARIFTLIDSKVNNFHLLDGNEYSKESMKSYSVALSYFQFRMNNYLPKNVNNDR